MADYDNDDMHRLQRWWQNNGTALVAGVALGLVIIVGWQLWQWHAANQSREAAAIYQQITAAFEQGNQPNLEGVVGEVERLKDDYSGTPYAAAAALRLAGYYVEQDRASDARQQLEWAMNQAQNEGVAHVARVRAARLAWSTEDAAAALALLDHEHPDSFASLYAEAEGDIHAAQGDSQAAYAAYERALANLPSGAPSNALESKLADNAPAGAEPAAGPDQPSTTAS